MDTEKLKSLLQAELAYLLTEEEVEGQRCGDSGQYDDTFDAGQGHGRAELAEELLAKFFPQS